jgi:hypothetical protein
MVDANPQAQFEESLQTQVDKITYLRQRYSQIQTAQAQQAQLQEHRLTLEAQGTVQQLPELERELQQVAEELDRLQLILESELLGDRQLQQLFWQELRRGIMGEALWQIVRFGGLGVLLGWCLKSWTN